MKNSEQNSIETNAAHVCTLNEDHRSGQMIDVLNRKNNKTIMKCLCWEMKDLCGEAENRGMFAYAR